MSDETNGLQKSINQIGIEAVTRYLPRGMRIHNCDIHGGYLAHYKDANPLCPLCTPPAPTDIEENAEGNGTTATQVEHYIDLRDNPLSQVVEAIQIAAE